MATAAAAKVDFRVSRVRSDLEDRIIRSGSPSEIAWWGTERKKYGREGEREREERRGGEAGDPPTVIDPGNREKP